jgi:hypothetical protein
VEVEIAEQEKTEKSKKEKRREYDLFEKRTLKLGFSSSSCIIYNILT